MEFYELFNSHEDYPVAIAERGVEQGILYQYVSSSFLNGYINYVRPIRAAMVHRYTDPSKSCTEKVQNINKCQHTDLTGLPDDVLVLAQSFKSYWFFWYDKDCSDCCIGRIVKDDYDYETVLKSFGKFLEEEFLDSGPIHNINLTGWVTG